MRRRKIEIKQAFRRTLIGGAEAIPEGSDVDERERRAVGEVADRGPRERRLHIGHPRDAGGAGGVVEERLVAGGDNCGDDGRRDVSLKLSARSDVHAPLGNPVGLESTAAADVESGDELTHEHLVRLPARLSGLDRREERSINEEVLREYEAEPLPNVLASEVRIDAQPAALRRTQAAEDGEIQRANVTVLRRDGGGNRWSDD